MAPGTKKVAGLWAARERAAPGQPSKSSSRSHLRLDRIVEINLMDGGIDFAALRTHALEVRARAAGKDFLDLTEAQLRAQTSGDAHRQFGFALGEIAEDVQGRIDTVDGEAHGMRKIGIQQQKF